MIDAGNFAGGSGRFYGLPSVESTPPAGLESEPIIRYGISDDVYGGHILASSATLTIQSNLSQQIVVTEPFSPNQKFENGWVIVMYGGNQRANSATTIELKSQPSLFIQFLSGQNDRTFRVGQTLKIAYQADQAKYMLGTVLSFVPAVGQIVVDVFYHDGGGTFDNWTISVYENDAISTDYMLARITSISYPTVGGQPILMTFQSYQAYGEGTFSTWSIGPQWNRAYNFVRNLDHSAYDASIGSAPNPGATFFPFGGDTTVTNVVTSNTPFLKSGYTQIVSQGNTVVYEDEYEVHRPYLDRNVRAVGYMETVTVTTVTTYDQYLNPTSVTTTNIDQAPISRSHTFTDADYVAFDQPGVKFFAGNPAVYSNGELVAAPTPSYYVRNDQTDGSISYYGNQYEQRFQTFEFGDPPVEYILEVFNETIGKAPIITGYERPNPEGFFYPP